MFLSMALHLSVFHNRWITLLELDNAGETLKYPEVDKEKSVKKEKSGPDPIIVPIVLKMADFDHKVWSLSFHI